MGAKLIEDISPHPEGRMKKKRHWLKFWEVPEFLVMVLARRLGMSLR